MRLSPLRPSGLDNDQSGGHGGCPAAAGAVAGGGEPVAPPPLSPPSGSITLTFLLPIRKSKRRPVDMRRPCHVKADDTDANARQKFELVSVVCEEHDTVESLKQTLAANDYIYLHSRSKTIDIADVLIVACFSTETVRCLVPETAPWCPRLHLPAMGRLRICPH